MNTARQKKLTILVKHFFNLTWYLFIFFAIAWPVMVMVVGLSISADPEKRHADISVYSGFKINTDVSTGLANSTPEATSLLLSGHGDLKIENTRSRLSWYLFGTISQVMLFIFLLGLWQMRRLFSSLAVGNTFTERNVQHVRVLGYVVIAWNIILPALQYFGGRLMLSDIAFDIPGIQLYPSFELDIGGVFVGLAILVLSGVLHEAVNIKKDQVLTI
ncbi:MAG: DUF2975 domain-containing protein [Xanthomonadales bacterium]|nr:DUF2975 domain-containing protein [Xanthomonadales bacterium]